MVRSKEELAVWQSLRIRGGVRLHKRVVTETVTRTVQMRREELVVTDLGPEEMRLQTSRATDHELQLGDREFDLILHEEQIVMTTAVVPVERVRVRVEVVTDHEQIVETVREEHLDLVEEPSLPSPPTVRH